MRRRVSCRCAPAFDENLLPPSILIMEAAGCSEKSLHIYQSIRRHNTERVSFYLITV
jgi:hypothetical protein